MKGVGIECNHCGYKDTTAKWEDYERFINLPCPECGCIILTQKDYNHMRLLRKFEDMSVEYEWPRDQVTVKHNNDRFSTVGVK